MGMVSYRSIETRFLSPTNYLGGRVKAMAGRGRNLTLPWDHACGVDENHRRAALGLAAMRGWEGRWAAGGTDGGFVFVRLAVFEDDVAAFTVELPAEERAVA